MGLSRNSQNIRQWCVSKLKEIKEVLSKESDETKEMLQTYIKFTFGEASEEQMKRANSQFSDILKALGLGAFAILPFAPLTIPFAVKLGEYFGIDILPSSYRKIVESRAKNKANK